MMDEAKKKVLEELLEQIHGKMGEDYQEEPEGGIESAICEECGEATCGCEPTEENTEIELDSEIEEPEGADEDLMEALKAFMNKDGGSPGPSTPKVGMPLTSEISVMEIEASPKPKKSKKAPRKAKKKY